MNKRIIAAMASMFLFTFVAKAEIMDLGIKLHSAVYAPRTVVTTNETVVDNEAKTKEVKGNSYYYYDGKMSGFINGRYGIALEPLFNVGYGFKLGIGLGAYVDLASFSSISKSTFDSSGNEIKGDTVSDGSYVPSNPERLSTIAKNNRFSLIPQAIVKWEFVELDPVTIYFLGKAGLSMPFTFADLKYDNKKMDSSVATGDKKANKDAVAEELSWNWLSNTLNFEAGFGIRWLGMEAELLGAMFNDSWNVKQTQVSYEYKDAKVSSNPGDTRTVSCYTYGVMLQLGYNLEGLF